MRGAGNCLKYLKKRVEQSRGGDTKIVKKGAKLGKGVGALKKGGCSLLTNYG